MGTRIDAYEFGRMTINGKTFSTDLIIYPDERIRADWWRRQGHELVPEDIEALLEAAPDRLIIGTGANGRMSVSGNVITLCRERDIGIEMLPTHDAAKRFNEAAEEVPAVAACFHLTC